MVEREIIPQTTAYLNSIIPLKDISYYNNQIKKVVEIIESIDRQLTKLKNNLDEVHYIESLKNKGLALRNEVFPLLDLIRGDVDKLELILPKQMYPFPSYLDLLFLLD